MNKVLKDCFSIRGQNGFRMKLKAKYGIIFVGYGHNLSILGLCGNGQAVRKGIL